MPQAIDKQQELLDKRNKAFTECRRIADDVNKSEKKEWTAEQRSEFAKWKKEATEAKDAYDLLISDQSNENWLKEAANGGNQPANGRISDPAEHTSSQNKDKGPKLVSWNPYKDTPRFARVPDRGYELTGPRAEENYRKAFAKYIKGDKSQSEQAFGDAKTIVRNALRSDDEEQGGYLITSEQFMEGLLKEVDDRVFVQSLARVLIVRDARSLGIRKRTAKANSIQKGSELRDITGTFDTSLRFGKRVLTPYYFTGGIQVSNDFLRMSTLDGEQIVRSEMALDMAEYNEGQFLYGNGIEGPLGVMIAHAEGIPTTRDITSRNADWLGSETPAPTTAYTFTTLARAKFGLKLQYRNRARWMFHRDHIAFINTIRDLNGQYMFQMSRQAGEPDRLMGLPCDESEWMPNTFTTGTYAGILACWEHYLIVYGLELEVRRLNEIAARTNQVEFHYRYKMDANVDLEEAFVRIKFA